MTSQLPEGFRAGHWTDRNAWTGCTAIVAPEATVASCEVRGGGPGTRETDLLGPGSAIPGVDAVILSGGSAFGLSAADGVSRWLEENDRGFETAATRIPLVGSAVVYDLALGSSTVRPTADAGFRACENAQPSIEGGSVGAGTGCTVGKLLGTAHWTKGGLGYAVRASSDGVTVGAIAVANAFGDVLDESGEILAGIWRDGYVRTVDLLAGGHRHTRVDREATTLVCIVTDAALTKTQAWTVARAGSAGVARAVDPAATTVDGDAVFCLASGVVPADPLTVAVVAADVTSAAIRDGVRRAGGAPGCPAVSERAGRPSRS